MRLSFGQQMQLAQKQVLAPRMIQSMEILQLPIMALQERIEQEMEENPCLDRAEEPQDAADGPAEDAQADNDTGADGEQELVIDESKNNEEDFERLLNMAENLPDDYEERSRPSRGQMEADADRAHDQMANMAARPESLSDYLHHQLSWFEADDAVRRMAERIIFSLDSNGYLKTPLEELIPAAPVDLSVVEHRGGAPANGVHPGGAEANGAHTNGAYTNGAAAPGTSANGAAEHTPPADPRAEQLRIAEEALALVQHLDPRGVGARSLRECLLLQVTPGMRLHDEVQTLISDHLEDLENNRMPVISKKTGYSIDLINEAWQELRKLKPKPGAEFSEATVPSVTPDVFVEKNDDGRYEVRLEDSQLPSLWISPGHRAMLQQASAAKQKETVEWIKRKINAAQWLIEAIEQRRSTLTRVSQAIVDHQTKFLDNGPEFIEPLKMQQIADKVGVHVTTVSRAVDDKWIQAPRGIYPLKRFFVGGTTSADGEDIAWDRVRLKLQEIVDGEDKQKPLSDDALVHALADHGITVARRTVTKYRKAMNIPSSRQRRDWSKAAK
ncbi:MAG: RNA polymerase factor sigma-54 [Planctomycetota bacterium]